MNYISIPQKTTLLIKTELTYTFTGGTRDGSIAIAEDAVLSISDEHRQLPSDKLFVPKGRTINIKRARIISGGADELQPAVGKVAAALKIKQGTVSDGTFVPDVDSAEIPLVFSKWNEWEEKNFSITAKKDNTEFAISDDSAITVDDYNVQTAYVGEEFSVTIEADVELTDTVG
jgi:hypothetical protein